MSKAEIMGAISVNAFSGVSFPPLFSRYESEKEHKKKYLKGLIFGGGYHFHIISFLVLALIIGTIWSCESR